MKKQFVPILVMFVIFSFSSGVYAKNSCGSVLCLSGMLTGDNPSECKQYIKDYFSIRKFKHGKWKIGKTIKKRYNYLRQCPEGRAKIIRINATYGHIYDM